MIHTYPKKYANPSVISDIGKLFVCKEEAYSFIGRYTPESVDFVPGHEILMLTSVETFEHNKNLKGFVVTFLYKDKTFVMYFDLESYFKTYFERINNNTNMKEDLKLWKDKL